MNKKICWSIMMHNVLFLFKDLSNSFNDTSTAIKDTSMYFKKAQALQRGCSSLGRFGFSRCTEMSPPHNKMLQKLIYSFKAKQRE
jgi:hypothetical protein